MEKDKQPTKQHKQNSFIWGVQKLTTVFNLTIEICPLSNQ